MEDPDAIWKPGYDGPPPSFGHGRERADEPSSRGSDEVGSAHADHPRRRWYGVGVVLVAAGLAVVVLDPLGFRDETNRPDDAIGPATASANEGQRNAALTSADAPGASSTPATVSSTEVPTARTSVVREWSTTSSAQGSSLEAVDVALPSPFLRVSADPADLLQVITIGQRDADDPCVDAPIWNLPPLGDFSIPLRSAPAPFESGDDPGVERMIPNGVRVVYDAGLSTRQEAFTMIAEAMTRCVGEMPFRERDRDGVIRVEPVDIGLVGDDRVAVRVSDVGPNSGDAGWTADYYWIGFALDDSHLAGVALNEAWRGDGTGDWPEEYPQPTITESELITQLEEALASGS